MISNPVPWPDGAKCACAITFDIDVLSPQERLLNKLTTTLKSGHSNKAVFSYKLLEKLDPHNIPKYINSVLRVYSYQYM